MLRPPSVASLSQSLGKRSREPSEEDDGPDEFGKKSRTGDTTPVEHVAPSPPDAAPDEEEFDEAEPSDEPMVSVAGKEMPFSEVTEDMTEQMTADEYTRYFEVMSTVG
jgi:transcription initiation factor TFIIE subunit alpha